MLAPTPRILLIISLLGLFLLVAFLSPTGGLAAFDRAALGWFYELQHPQLTAGVVALSLLGSGWVLIPASATVTLLLLRRWRAGAAFFAASMIGEALLYGLCMAVFNRPRPTLYPHLSREFTASFPSGHVLATVIFWGALYVLARRRTPHNARLVGGVGLLAVLVIGLSRLYLQVHHPSDVVASLLLGGAWVLLLEGVFSAAALFSPPRGVKRAL